MRRLIFLLLTLSSFTYFTVAQNEEFKFIPFNNTNPQGYTAVVLRNGVPVCAGALIAVTTLQYVVVTAAHCVYPVSANKISVQLSNSQPIEAHRVFVYPHYAPPSIDFDIAIIKCKIQKPRPFEESYVAIETPETPPTSPGPPTDPPKEIPLSETEPEKGALVNICVRNSSSAPWTFKNETGTVENKKVCKSVYEGILSVSKRMICAYSNSTGADGSPLVFNGKLAGITSKTGSGRLPTIYTNLVNSDIRFFVDSYL